jgi:hypothetical protein
MTLLYALWISMLEKMTCLQHATECSQGKQPTNGCPCRALGHAGCDENCAVPAMSCRKAVLRVSIQYKGFYELVNNFFCRLEHACDAQVCILIQLYA